MSLQVNQGAAQRRAEQLRSQSTETFQRSCDETFCVFCCCFFLKFICIYLLICLCIYLFVCCRSEEDSEGNRDICSEILQMKALERLTSTVSRHSENFFFLRKTNKFEFLFVLIDIFLFFLFFRNRYKVSWRLLWPGRLAKPVSVFLLTKKTTLKKKNNNKKYRNCKMIENHFPFFLFFCFYSIRAGL